MPRYFFFFEIGDRRKDAGAAFILIIPLLFLSCKILFHYLAFIMLRYYKRYFVAKLDNSTMTLEL